MLLSYDHAAELKLMKFSLSKL